MTEVYTVGIIIIVSLSLVIYVWGKWRSPKVEPVCCAQCTPSRDQVLTRTDYRSQGLRWRGLERSIQKRKVSDVIRVHRGEVD